MSHRNLDLDFKSIRNPESKGPEFIIIRASDQAGEDDVSNAVGKSTIPELISYLLYEKLLKDESMPSPNEVIYFEKLENGIAFPEGAKLYAYGEFSKFENPKYVLSIERTLTRSGKKTLVIKENGKVKEFDKKSDAQANLLEWLGLTFEMLSKRFLTPDSTKFIKLKPSERFKAISSFISFNWDKAYKFALNNGNGSKEQIEGCSKEIGTLEIQKINLIADKKVLEANKINCEVQISNLLEKTNGLLELVGEKNRGLPEAIKQLEKLQRDKEISEQIFIKLSEQLTRIEERSSGLEGQISILTAKLAALNIELESKKILLPKLDISLSKSRQDNLAVKERYQIVTKEVNILSSQITGLKTQNVREQLDKQFGSIGNIECPKCSTIINPKDIVDRIVAIKEKEILKQLGVLECQYDRIIKESKKIEIEKMKLETDLQGLVKTKSVLDTEISQIIKNVNTNKSDFDKLQKSQKASEKKLAEQLKNGIKIVDATIVNSLSDEVANAGFKYKSMEKLYLEASKNKILIETEIIQLDKNIADNKTELIKLKRLEKGINTAPVMEELDKILIQINENRKLLDNYKSESACFDIVKNGSHASSPARLFSVVKLCPFLSASVSTIFSYLKDRLIDIKFEVGESELVINTDSLVLKMLSTGEKQCFDISVACSLQELAMRTSKNQIGFFVGDELFDGLDGRRIRLATSLIANLKIPQNFIITHNPKAGALLEMLPNLTVIEVGSENGVSLATMHKNKIGITDAEQP